MHDSLPGRGSRLNEVELGIFARFTRKMLGNYVTEYKTPREENINGLLR
jgi:hypothetical protein